MPPSSGGSEHGRATAADRKELQHPQAWGDPVALRRCAEAWRQMAHDLQAAGRDLDQQVKDLSSADWDGRAATAFHEHWTHTKRQVDHALPNFERVAKELDQAADRIEDTNTQVEHVLEELAVTAAVGLGLTLITAGFSDAVAAGAAAAAAAEVGTARGAAGKAVSGKVPSALHDALAGNGFLGKAANGAVTGAGGQMAADGVDIPFHLGGKTTDSLIPDLLTSAGGGAAGGAAVHGGETRYKYGGGGRHRDPESGPEFGPGRQAAANCTVYGDANANENDITSKHKSPFDKPGSSLTDPQGAFDTQGES
ncbi:WXG100 family type VII secretion target [Streptomyces sp. NPDC057743]|uniref:WXG100 family type VII secretion target n=1 Tax=Streptomyces sp. NPDC057743 TaxID=3346236 RepID=UPI00369B8A29